MSESPLLLTEALSVERGGQYLFADVSFHLNRGDALWVRGRNGSGKTSLLRTLCGLTSPARGAVLWRRQTVPTAIADSSLRLFYLGHLDALKDELSVRENLLLQARLRASDVAPATLDTILQRLGLAPLAARRVRALSRGQRRRLALAPLLFSPAPDLALLDEPFAALDTESIDTLSQVLGQYLQAGGVLVYSTHQAVQLGSRPLQQLTLTRPPASQTQSELPAW